MFKLHRQKAEKPSDKVDFRLLEFQATQVPVSCDKLVVSIISVETGKAVAKTNKALVRSGNCQWSEAVSESVRFLPDDTSKELEDKLFKFVVSTGSPRSGILGEATINLADYLSSKLPVPLSLPLKKCNHGTILHVKIHCLSPRVGSRQSEHWREHTIEPDDQNSVSDDTDNRSEGSDQMIGSVGSLSGNRLGRGSLQNKDGASSPSSSRFSSDSGELLSSGSSTANGISKNVLNGGQVSPSGSTNNLPRRQASAGSRDGSATNRTGNGQDSYKSSPSPYFNGKGAGSVSNLQKQWQERTAQGSASSIRGSEPSKGSLEVAEATIQELHTEAMTWERNARKLGAEMETLKHQFSEQTKHQSELAVELSAAQAERDSLNMEVEQLKSSLQASIERESALNNTRFDADDAKRTVKELQEEIELQKQSNANLNLQLRKTQESNMELVSALQELEETIQQQNIELDKFSEERQKLDGFEALKQEYDRIRLHTESGLQLSPSEDERDSLKKEVEELRSALQESMSRCSFGDTAGAEAENFKFTNQRLQEEIETEKAPNNNLNLQVQNTEASYKHLLFVVRDLEEKLKEQDIEIEHLLDANKRLKASAAQGKLHSIDVEAEWMQNISSKEEEIGKLEAQVSSFEMQKSLPDVTEYRDESKEDLRKALEISKREIDELERDCKELTDENMELIYKLNKLNKYLESKNISIAEIEEKRVSQSESTLNTSLASDRDAYVSQIQQQLDNYSSKEKHLQGTIHQLECVNLELQSEIQNLKEEQCTKGSSIEELELQLSLYREETQSLRSSKHEFETKASNLQAQKIELEEKLQITEEEIKAAIAHIDELAQELSSLTASMESQNSAKRSLEKKTAELESTKEELDRHLTDLEVENVQLSERVLGLEAQLRYMTEERESYRLDLENTKSCGNELQTNFQRLELELREENEELLKSLHESENKLSGALEEAESYKREYEKLELKLNSLMNEYSESKEKQKEEICNLSLSCANLEEQLQELRGHFSSSVKQVKSLESDLATLQTNIADKERVRSIEMEALLVSSKENEQRAVRAEEEVSQVRLQKATAVQHLENEVQRLTEQMSSTYDEKERMATKALLEAAELRAEKVKLEDSLHQTQGEVRHREMELSSVRQDYKIKVQELILQIAASKEKEEEMNFSQENAHRQLEDMELCEKKLRQRIEELERKIQLLQSENQKLKDEQSDLSSQAHDMVNLRAEMDNLRSTVEGIMTEKSRLESSLQIADVELGKLSAEKMSLIEKVSFMQVAISEVDGLKRSKDALEDKLLRLQAELSAKEASSAHDTGLKNESARLKMVNSQFQRKLGELEEEREESKSKVQSLEEELKLKSDALYQAEQKVLSMPNSKMEHKSSSQDSKEVAELREKLCLVESDHATLVKEFEEKEKDLCAKIGYLEIFNKQFKQAKGDSGADHLQLELTRLQKENLSLSQQEHELQSKLGAQDLLQKELEKLKEVNKHLQSQLSRFKETKSGDMIDRVLALEIELAEALESSAMYKSQLKSFLCEEQNVHAAALQNFGTVDQVVNDLTRYKRTTSSLETELKDMRERYLRMSLQFAEVEAQREELVMQVKSLKNGKKRFW